MNEIFRSQGSGRRDGNRLTIRIQPDEGISLGFIAKRPGLALDLGMVAMDFRYEPTFESRLVEAYERLLYDAMQGDRTLFTGADGVERAWEILEPVLDDPPPLHSYIPGSWGPAEADRLIAPRGWGKAGIAEAPRPK